MHNLPPAESKTQCHGWSVFKDPIDIVHHLAER